MARLPRLVIAGLPHVVSLQVQHQQTLAQDDDDRSGLLALLCESAQQHGVAIHAFAIGNDGLDLLASPSEAPALGRLMQGIARRHAAAFNRRHDRHGSLWSGRYRTAALEPQAWTLRCMRWVETRAQRKQTFRVGEPAADWSSALHHTGGATHRWLVDPPSYWSLGNTPFEREGVYRQWLAAMPDAVEAERIEAALRGGWFLGEETFLRRLISELSRPVAPRSPGRPRSAQVKLSPK